MPLRKIILVVHAIRGGRVGVAGLRPRDNKAPRTRPLRRREKAMHKLQQAWKQSVESL